MNPRAALIALAIAAIPAHLAAQSDVIRGKVTDAQGAPVADARVTATSIPGNLVKQTRTDKKGAYQIVFPNGEGDYIIGIHAIGHAYRQFQVKRTADQDLLLGDAKLQPILLDPVTTVANAQQQRVPIFSTTPDVGGTERPVSVAALPLDMQGNIAAMAASVPGVQLLPGVDGSADAFSVFGLGADQNSIMMNGMPSGMSSLPRDALINGSLVTSPYDVGRGGFSGAQMNVSVAGGNNISRRGFNSTIVSPALTWTDRAGSAVGAKRTNISAGGIFSGPIKLNTSFYSFSYELRRNSNDLRTLLNTDPLGLRSAGVSTDSVARLLGILQSAGISPHAAGIGQQQRSDNGSFVGTYNYNAPTSTKGITWGMTSSANWQRQRPTNIGPTDVPSAGGDRTNYGGGLQLRGGGYFGLVLTETNVGVNLSRNFGSPYLQLPSGRVRVTSTLEDGDNSIRNLAFGGAPNLSTESTTLGASLNNALSWFSDNNKHRLKLTTDLRYERSRSDQSNNLLGTFTFNSLEDLENGNPATYTRQLTARQRTTGGLTGSMSLGNSYRRSPDLQIQYGVRVDATRFDRRPHRNTAVETTFGVRNDYVPQKLYVSPRIGFSWTVGTAPQIASFEGAVRGPRAIVRGGIGVFQNASSASLISSALENTGLPSGVQQLYCTGAAVPRPDWAAYEVNPFSVPDQCADGSAGTVFSTTAPNVSLIDRGFQAQRRVSSNLSWNGRILNNRFSANVEGTYAVNMNQQRTIDLNFLAEQRFTLANEGGRPVFVQPTSIVPATGAIAVRDARQSSAFNRVNLMKSDLRGETRQITVSLTPVYTTTPRITYRGSYTFQHGREQVSGFTSTAGNPLEIGWARTQAGMHQINYSLGYNIKGYVGLSWNGSFLSGRPFTPMVGGDVNGDGSGGNDRAFVFDPATASDPALAGAMSALLEQGDRRTRDCLRKQLGALARRNSCSTPWSTSGSLSITLDPIKLRMPHRARLEMSLSNPLGAADLALNGSDDLKGWGAPVTPDQTLLYVRGFDPATQRYRYEVNQRFGATRPALITLRNPVVLTLGVRVDLGQMRERQTLQQRLDPGRRTPGLRASESILRLNMISGAIPNPFLTIIANQDSLRLTVEQSDSIAAMSRRFTYRVDSLWTPVLRRIAALPDDYDPDAAFEDYLEGRKKALAMLEALAPTVKSLLTAEQRRKLPASVNNALDPLWLAAVRHGTSTYIGAGFVGGAAPPPPGGFTVIR